MAIAQLQGCVIQIKNNILYKKNLQLVLVATTQIIYVCFTNESELYYNALPKRLFLQSDVLSSD